MWPTQTNLFPQKILLFCYGTSDPSDHFFKVLGRNTVPSTRIGRLENGHWLQSAGYPFLGRTFIVPYSVVKTVRVRYKSHKTQLSPEPNCPDGYHRLGHLSDGSNCFGVVPDTATQSDMMCADGDDHNRLPMSATSVRLAEGIVEIMRWGRNHMNGSEPS